MERFLIVDADVPSARSLAQRLEELGYEDTHLAHSAAHALEAAVELGASIVFLDIDLPDMSGYEAARLLHRHPRLQEVRLIALTDSVEHAGRERARESGFERYLVKPVTAAALQKVLHTPGHESAGTAFIAAQRSTFEENQWPNRTTTTPDGSEN